MRATSCVVQRTPRTLIDVVDLKHERLRFAAVSTCSRASVSYGDIGGSNMTGRTVQADDSMNEAWL